jgi:hypothetical protein
MSARRLRVGPWLLLALMPLLLWGAAAAQDLDLHALFEARCARCHGHAGAFARAKLAIVAGDLVGRESGRPVTAFLPTHFGRPSPAEVTGLRDMLARQVAAGGLFAEHCVLCHVRARDLVRESLLLVDGRLVGRYSGRAIADFLEVHGRLAPAERPVVLESLREIAAGR